MFQASGTVYRSGGKERVSYATIKASKGNLHYYTTTNDDGDFRLEIPEPGSWEFVALASGSHANQPVPVDMSQHQSGIKIYLDRIAETTDDHAGKIFFWVLLGVLGVVLVAYILTHVWIKDTPARLSGASVEAATRLSELISSSKDLSQDQAIPGVLDELSDDITNALNAANTLKPTDRKYLSQAVDDIRAAVTAGEQERALSLLADLQVVIDPSPTFSFWSTEPLRLLEILFWGLAGILVSKIFTTGWYLRSHRFYREGILMHIAHLAATPILVLVTVLLLSLVTMQFTLSNNNAITVDLADPRIMVAFAFIIGTSPWPLWNFILNTAKRFTGQLGQV